MVICFCVFVLIPVAVRPLESCYLVVKLYFQLVLLIDYVLFVSNRFFTYLKFKM